MATIEIDDLLDRLEEAFEAGRPLTVEEVCRDCPEHIEAVRKKWSALQRFDDRFCTRQETESEVVRKLASMPESVNGARLVVQSELYVKSVHAEGGLGVVYESDDQELSRRLAVKMPKGDVSGSEALEGFRREIEIIGRLNHPGVVSIVGHGETFDKRPFYAMPFMDCGNLQESADEYHQRDRVHAKDAEFRDLIYRLASVCKTIAYTHSRGVMHLDLKPQNIMLGRYGETVVIDWGCANHVKVDPKFKVHAEPTVRLTKAGDSQPNNFLTLRYASPEQLSGTEIAHASDIYSLGAMLYKLITGKAPLEQEAHSNVAKRVIAGEITDPLTVKPGIPKALAGICRKAMAVRPADRYENAMKMAEDLENYLADEPVSACAENVTSIAGRFMRRNKTASILLLGTLLVTSLMLAGAFARSSVMRTKATQSAKERLKIAATMAGRIGELEIEKRTSLLQQQASTPELAASLIEFRDTKDADAARDRIQAMLARLEGAVRAADIEVESMFITDSTGIQVARVPWSGESIGKDFSYRHYFHGDLEKQSLSKEELLKDPLPPDDGPLFSTIYRSTNVDQETGKYNPIKVAFSVPIVGPDAGGKESVLGRLGLAIEVNQLNLFRELDGITLNAYLIEMRDYDWEAGDAQGVIIDSHFRNASHLDVVKDINEITKLSDDSVTQLSEMMKQNNVTVLDKFQDAIIAGSDRETACVFLRNPVSDDLGQVWAMIFTEAGE